MKYRIGHYHIRKVGARTCACRSRARIPKAATSMKMHSAAAQSWFSRAAAGSRYAMESFSHDCVTLRSGVLGRLKTRPGGGLL